MTNRSAAPTYRTWWHLPAIALAVVLLDQASKLGVRRMLTPAQSIPLIPDILYLSHVRNPGAAFGLFPERQPFFFVVTAGVTAFILAYYLLARPTERLLVAALGLELGGAAGNLVDRAITGRVTDFIDVRFWPVFNIADSAIVIGVMLLGLGVLLRGRTHAAQEGEE